MRRAPAREAMRTGKIKLAWQYGRRALKRAFSGRLRFTLDGGEKRRTEALVLISPMIVPIIIIATGMFFFYSNPCNIIGVECGRLTSTYFGVILAHTTLGIPFVIITVTATLSGFDQSLIRASASLGASPSRTFFKVVMPLILPGVIAGAILAFAKAMGEFGATITFVSNIPGQTQTLPSAIYSFLQVPGGEAQAARLVMVAIALAMGALLLSEWVSRAVARLLRGLDDGTTRVCVEAERAMNRKLQGGCQVPIGAFAVIEADTLWLRGLVGAVDGSEIIRHQLRGPVAQGEQLGAELAEYLLSQGADRILQAVYQAAP